jgi:YD repeat-containing protein
VKSFLELLAGVLSIVLLLQAASAVAQLPSSARRYAIIQGDPCCGIDEKHYKYSNADEGCAAEFVPPPDPCHVQHLPSRSMLGPHPTQISACFYTFDCVCEVCRVGSPGDPRNFNIISPSNTQAHPQTFTCTGGLFRDTIECTFAKQKGKGNSCRISNPRSLVLSNPCDIGNGNKFQTETIYRSGTTSGLDLALSYNSKHGLHYFQVGPFGAKWTSRYSVAVKDTLQAMVVVSRPDGRELEFAPPPSGTHYLKDPDVNETLERLLNGTGATVGWRLYDSHTEETEEFDAGGNLMLVRDRSGRQLTMTYSTSATPPAIAPAAGLLIAVTDQFGRQLNFTYNAQKRVAKLVDPGGSETLFQYDGPSGPPGAKNLTRITFPDLKTRVYHYGETAHINGGAACPDPSPIFPNALTGLVDENGVRYATWTYQCDGRVASSEHAAGADKYVFSYGNGVRSWVDPLNTSRSMSTASVIGITKNLGTTQPSARGTGTSADSATYDANGNLSSRTDYRGNRTDYAYDLVRNLETSRTEGLTASGTPTPQTRTISTQWHPVFRLPVGIAEPLRITTHVYDLDGTQCGARGALCSKSIQPTTDASGAQGFSAASSGAARTWTYTYNLHGNVLTTNGPRTDAADVTSYTYYADNEVEPGKRANIASITNALGHTTNITEYNAHGQPLTIVDANGLTTTMSYDARQRLKTRTVGSETTTYDYDFVGQLTRVTLADGSFLSYSYDNAHRLTGMQDNLGNRIVYTLDAIGNRTQEQVFDPANQLAQTRSRVFDSLNRLFRELGAQSQTTEYAYDEQGNLASVKDPLNRVTSNQYDALNRLTQVTSAPPISAVTRYGYNGLDALVQVTDPRNLVTGYAVDGLGNLNVQTSPDTGTTTNTYDSAGNLLTQTDAKSQVTTYAYDALNRVTLITFHDGSKQTYNYDQGANAIGRLSSITEADAANQTTSVIAYAYDPHGRVSSETRSVGGAQYVLAYRYDSAGRLDQLTYPSGRTVSYAFDGLGRVNAITTTKPGDEAQSVVSNVAYHSFGGVKGYTLGNGQIYSRGIDLDGRIASYTLGAQSFAIGYDVASRISFITDVADAAKSITYGYDELDRLTSASLPTVPYAYSYDAVGNRLSRTAGSSTHTYEYSTTSNRLASITPSSGPVRSFSFDPNGSTTADGLNTYAYDVRGRMVSATSALGTTNYQVNALGQRIRKMNSLGDTVFHYDTQGRLIAETSPGGALKRELIYLGDIPVGVVQ